jgi:hypothetical protein
VYKVNFVGKTIARNCVELRTLEKVLLMKHPDREILELFDQGFLD